MKLTVTVLLAVALCGCALNPAELREQGIRREFAMRMDPSDAAACVARNMENSDTWAGVHVRTAVRAGYGPGQTELVVSYVDHFFITANFEPDGAGAKAVVFASPRMAESLRDRLLGAFNGC